MTVRRTPSLAHPDIIVSPPENNHKGELTRGKNVEVALRSVGNVLPPGWVSFIIMEEEQPGSRSLHHEVLIMKALSASFCAVLALYLVPIQVLAQGRFGSFRPSGSTFKPGGVVQQFLGGGSQGFNPGTSNVVHPTTPTPPVRFYPGGGSQANNPTVTPPPPGKQYYMVGGGSQSNNPFPGTMTTNVYNPFPATTSYYDTLYPQPVFYSTVPAQQFGPTSVSGGGYQKNNPDPDKNVSPFTDGGNQGFDPLTTPAQVGSGSTQPILTYLTERYLRVRNIGNETIRVHLRWYGDNGQGQKQWLPPGGEVLSYTIRPNTEGYLTWNKTRIKAEKVRLWGSTSSGKSYTAYRQRDLFLVEEVQGRRHYQAASLQTHTVTFRQ